MLIKSLSILALATAASTAMAAPRTKPVELEAQVSSVSQKNLKGDVVMEQVKGGLHVKAHVTGLAPNSTHGIHVHENGECAGPDYKSAGGHFNPDKGTHGPAEKETSHQGDLGNIVADARGEGTFDKVIPNKDMKDIKMMNGKSIIIHAKTDDLNSQPAGDSGERIGCGIFKAI